MPLSPPADRELLHLRDIELRGYRRADGLFDIEARLTDTKSYGFGNTDRGWIEPGVPLHGMLARMTLTEDMVITQFEAVTDYGPYSICPSAAPNFARLAGLRIGRGFLKEANQRVGGVHGCTHLRELLGQMGTVAFQTLFAVRAKKQPEPDAAKPNATETTDKPRVETTDKPRVETTDKPMVETTDKPRVETATKPMMLGTCLAYAPDSPVVQRQWPAFYTGPATP